MKKQFKYLGFNDMGKTTKSEKEQCDIHVVSNSTAWKPTSELRWLEHRSFDFVNNMPFMTLQQKWVSIGGEEEWRKIQIVKE